MRAIHANFQFSIALPLLCTALSVKSLKGMLKERGIAIPPGFEKGNLAKLLYEKTILVRTN